MNNLSLRDDIHVMLVWGVGEKMDDSVSVVAKNQNQQRRSKKGDVLKS